VASVSPKKLAWALILIGGPGLAGPGCHSQNGSAGPTMEFTKAPAAAQGGRERVDTIAERFRNVHLKFSGYDRVPLRESWQMEDLGS
jgi:hypothetical protein